jgi:transcriptional regulator GlxA family with amidase domain
MHRVAVLVQDRVVPLDLAIPCELLGRLRLEDGSDAYRVQVCSEVPLVETAAFGMRVPWRLNQIAQADTVIVPGTDDADLPISEAVREALCGAAARGSRIVSICSGAFTLAAAGLLDGLRATTHWIGVDLLASRYPQILVERGSLFVDNGAIITSAGASAGLDTCLHLIRCDYGQAVAAHAARLAVAPLDRAGGQSQFIRRQPPSSHASLAPLLEWMRVNAHRPISIEAMAGQAATSTRTLARRFREQTRTTPLQWLLELRVRNAQELLEATDLSLDAIAGETGFVSASTLRDRFRRIVGTSPGAYRRMCGRAAV